VSSRNKNTEFNNEEVAKVEQHPDTVPTTNKVIKKSDDLVAFEAKLQEQCGLMIKKYQMTTYQRMNELLGRMGLPLIENLGFGKLKNK